MKKSIFRFIDRIELCIIYLFCFVLNLIFDYGKSLNVESYVLELFLDHFMKRQMLIVLLFTLIAVVWHYKILNLKKEEIHCRILVGDTIQSIIIRYIFECLIILISIFLLMISINIFSNRTIINTVYLFFTFVVYILISAIQVRKYENF